MCALETEEAYAIAHDGTRIFYRVSGKGPFALVMPVTWGMDSFVYTRGFSSLAFYLALVTFDPRGIGGSGPVATDEEFSLETAATDAAEVADAVGLTRSVVLGHSGGGALALTFALRYPERVSHLVLISTAAQWDAPSPLPMEPGFPRTEDEMRERLRASVARAVHDPARFGRSMDELLPRMRFSPERLRWTADVGTMRYDVRKNLMDIHVPTLVIHGREDAMVPLSRAEELRDGIPGARLTILDACGHWPYVERRTEFVAAVLEFLGMGDRAP